MFVLAVIAHLHSPSHSPKYLLVLFIVGILNFLACLLNSIQGACTIVASFHHSNQATTTYATVTQKKTKKKQCRPSYVFLFFSRNLDRI